MLCESGGVRMEYKLLRLATRGDCLQVVIDFYAGVRSTHVRLRKIRLLL